MIEYASLIISVASVIVAVAIGGGQIYLARKMDKFEQKQNERDEKRRKDELFASVTAFIQKYSKDGYQSDIYLLPLCVVAYKYNPSYPYRREIYREFCSFTEDMQNLILQRCEINLQSARQEDYYDIQLKKYKKVEARYCPDDKDIFYDNGKYFERALTEHGTEPVPSLRCLKDRTQKETEENPVIKSLTKDKSPAMNFKDHITNELAYYPNEKPLQSLFLEQTDKGSAADGLEIIASYLCCMVAKYVSIYSHKDANKKEDIGCPEDFQGKEYMEDLFLDALYTMENYNV